MIAGNEQRPWIVDVQGQAGKVVPATDDRPGVGCRADDLVAPRRQVAVNDVGVEWDDPVNAGLLAAGDLGGRWAKCAESQAQHRDGDSQHGHHECARGLPAVWFPPLV